MTALSSDTSPAPIPSGTITFVFTDIEGSTQRWDRDRAAMEDAVRRHDNLMRAAIAAHSGHVFKTIGDAFCAAFARPEDAVSAVYDAQRTLGTEDFSAVDGLRVRAAIHTGTADERDRDYFGPAVNRVARLLGIGHGGQVLVSGVTSDLVQGALPSQASLRDLGEHRLKDLSRPEYVYQLLGPGLIAEFPPLRSLDALPNNLPLQSTAFIGRETEIVEITELVARNRLVTLVGSGGIGKTRTSLQVAANLLDGSGDGVWFVELAPLASGEYVAGTVAQVMGLSLPGDGDPVDHLVRALKGKRALLVFDNCEHIVEASARVTAALVRGCPQITILASSRQGLGIVGEATFRMPSLATPHDSVDPPLTAIDAMGYAAVALFVERARAADYRFALSEDNAPIVADICRRLDGIALAIELAAARVKILSPRQLRDRLDERFRLLTGGGRDVLPRQQTLRALIDWSHDLLDERERALFRRLGIFVGGFTIEGAAAVVGVETLDEFEVFDVLASLVEKSLVLAEPDGDALRYRLLESTRAYASERLAEAGERDRLAGRHLRYFRDRFVELRDEMERSNRNALWFEAFAAELDDLRFALDGTLARPDVVAGAELLAALNLVWMMGLYAEGIARNEAVLAALPADETLLRAKLATTLLALLLIQGRQGRALGVAMQACTYARTSGDNATLAWALRWYGVACMLSQEYSEAEAALSEAVAIPGPAAQLRLSLTEARAMLSRATGDLDGAARAYEQLLKEQCALGNIHKPGIFKSNLALIEHERGNTTRAIALGREVLAALRTGADRSLFAGSLCNFANFLVASDDIVGAIESAREAIATLASREPANFFVTCAIEILELVDALQGEFSRATRLGAYTDAALEDLGRKREFTEQAAHDRLTALLEANVAPTDRLRLTAEGAALTPEAAVALALEVRSIAVPPPGIANASSQSNAI